VNLFSPRKRETIAYAHGDRLTLDGHGVRLRVDARAKRVSLRIDQAKREVIATAPTPRKLAEAVAFAESRAVWIATQLTKLPTPATLAPGAVIEVLGQPCQLEAGKGRGRLIEATDEEPMRIIAPEGERFAATVLRLLKAEAKARLLEATEIHAKALGQPLPVMSLGDPRGRWGSCTPARRGGFAGAAQVGRIRYSWRLVLATPAVLDYVAAHECAHLVEANHGPDFWALVHNLVGDHRKHRQWLKNHGAALHAFGQG
jgi:predicted metal-dependent hydrolase